MLMVIGTCWLKTIVLFEDKNTTDTYLNCMINVSITTSGPLIMMKRTHSFVMPVASVNMPSLTTL